ncbi:hypothetical protein M501DRAFT_1015154 [Patellaria atrata CBS 101060]|uniref:Uncharacterized protein n=1 Tax=Patellaria atrata CBS 101060 TaxID=1346257 RepID=A0A9P4VS47_9PEZI|nr:hypothetical protein M501DRAFT_1015154 [Patellaria atrata CBS 101060]
MGVRKHERTIRKRRSARLNPTREGTLGTSWGGSHTFPVHESVRRERARLEGIRQALAQTRANQQAAVLALVTPRRPLDSLPEEMLMDIARRVVIVDMPITWDQFIIIRRTSGFRNVLHRLGSTMRRIALEQAYGHNLFIFKPAYLRQRTLWIARGRERFLPMVPPPRMARPNIRRIQLEVALEEWVGTHEWERATFANKTSRLDQDGFHRLREIQFRLVESKLIGSTWLSRFRSLYLLFKVGNERLPTRQITMIWGQTMMPTTLLKELNNRLRRDPSPVKDQSSRGEQGQPPKRAWCEPHVVDGTPTVIDVPLTEPVHEKDSADDAERPRTLIYSEGRLGQETTIQDAAQQLSPQQLEGLSRLLSIEDDLYVEKILDVWGNVVLTKL